MDPIDKADLVTWLTARGYEVISMADVATYPTAPGAPQPANVMLDPTTGKYTLTKSVNFIVAKRQELAPVAAAGTTA